MIISSVIHAEGFIAEMLPMLSKITGMLKLYTAIRTVQDHESSSSEICKFQIHKFHFGRRSNFPFIVEPNSLNSSVFEE